VSFDLKEFFKKQAEECRELERQAVDPEDQAFWRQAAERWQEQLSQAQIQTHKKPAALRAGKASFKYAVEG
jgi:hypothetical protein